MNLILTRHMELTLVPNRLVGVFKSEVSAESDGLSNGKVIPVYDWSELYLPAAVDFF